ncbi:glycosyltransferase [Pectinatus haikarae]|uniref:glycosyltransferase n=1 Tax=Pectinatus haikarae TaxID=349096 RepID=UPI0018C4ECD8|nr:glycosyltransferase [Pectinatus haikarae]
MAVTNLNEKEICFIINNTNFLEYENTVSSISRLICPDNYKILIHPFVGNNTAESYNEILQENNAKYKIYITAGTVFVNENFLTELIEIFRKNWAIGIVGASGASVLPTNGIGLQAINRVGKVMIGNDNILTWSDIKDTYQKVKVIDSYFMATQYDIKWREDIFVSEYFAKISQCIEFQRQNYLVVTAQQPLKSWCKIASVNISYSENEHALFLDEYSKNIYPLVSILIPTYNRPHFFEQALHSAVTQSYRNTEIIVGDDSTNDDTRIIVEKYQKKYDNIFYHKNGSEYSNVSERSYANYNRILHKSHGTYINYLNDDDIFHPEKINRMMNYYLEYDDIALVSSHRIFINENGEEQIFSGYSSIEVKCDQIIDAKTAVRALLLGTDNYIGEPTTALLRRCDIDNNFGTFFGTSFDCINDMAQWFESLKHGRLAYLKDSLSYMRVHKGQKTKDNSIWFAFKNDLFKFYALSFAHSFGFENEEEFIRMIKIWLYISNHKNAPFDLTGKTDPNISLFYDKDIVDEFLKNYAKAEKILKCNIMLQKNNAVNNNKIVEATGKAVKLKQLLTNGSIEANMQFFLKDFLKKRNKNCTCCCVSRQTEILLSRLKYDKFTMKMYRLHSNVDEIDSESIFVALTNEKPAEVLFDQADQIFDYIVLFDDIMHWQRPENILVKLKKCLKPDGIIVMNFYNVAYFRNIKNLLEGKWHYHSEAEFSTNCGSNLLLKENVKFFTIKSMYRMLDSIDLKIKNIAYVADAEAETDCAVFMSPYIKAGLASENDMQDFGTCGYILSIIK